MYLLFSCLVIEWAATERFYTWKVKLTAVFRCVQLFQAAVRSAERNLKFGSRPEIFGGLLLLCSFFIRFPFGCWPVISTAESWLPRDCSEVFVKDHKSLVAKKSRPAPQQLNSQSDVPYCQRKIFEALQTDRGQTPLRVLWHGSHQSHAGGLLSSASCWFVLSAPKAPGCSFQRWFGADGVHGGAGTSGRGAVSSVAWHLLLRLKWTPHPNIFYMSFMKFLEVFYRKYGGGKLYIFNSINITYSFRFTEQNIDS